jgi:hypothetical protein
VDDDTSDFDLSSLEHGPDDFGFDPNSYDNECQVDSWLHDRIVLHKSGSLPAYNLWSELYVERELHRLPDVVEAPRPCHDPNCVYRRSDSSYLALRLVLAIKEYEERGLRRRPEFFRVKLVGVGREWEAFRRAIRRSGRKPSEANRNQPPLPIGAVRSPESPPWAKKNWKDLGVTEQRGSYSSSYPRRTVTPRIYQSPGVEWALGLPDGEGNYLAIWSALKLSASGEAYRPDEAQALIRFYLDLRDKVEGRKPRIQKVGLPNVDPRRRWCPQCRGEVRNNCKRLTRKDGQERPPTCFWCGAETAAWYTFEHFRGKEVT